MAVEQIGHAFLFGANCFLPGAYDDAGLNRRYEECVLQLFNAATVAMYWRELERETVLPATLAADGVVEVRLP